MLDQYYSFFFSFILELGVLKCMNDDILEEYSYENKLIHRYIFVLTK